MKRILTLLFSVASIGVFAQCSITVTSQNPSCFGGTDGAITITPGGGTSYSYLWNNAETSQNISGLNDAIYAVTMVADGSCTVTESVTISEPFAISITGIGSTSVSCNGSSDGAYTISVTGGPVTSYSYAWSNGSSSSTATGLFGGVDAVTVTSGGCEESMSYTISEPNNFYVSTDHLVAESCNGNSDGEAGVTAYGGSSSYSYLWSNGETTSIITGLSEGIYDVTTSETGGCAPFIQSITVTAPDLLMISITNSQPTCAGNGTDGVATAMPNGGPSTMYTYVWDNASTDASLTGLIDGAYYVTVTSGACSVEDSVTLDPAIGMTMTDVVAICDGETYLAGGANQTVSGTYYDTYTLSNGCDSVVVTELTVKNNPTISVSSSADTICEGTSVTLLATGPTNSTFAWDNSTVLSNNAISNPVATPTNSTVFTVTITKNGCSSEGSVTITTQTAPTLSVTQDPDIENCISELTVVSSNGTSFMWTTPTGTLISSSTVVDVVIADTDEDYTVVATNSIGCSSNPVTITVDGHSGCSPVGINELMNNSFELYPNPNNGLFALSFASEQQRTISILDITGKVVYNTLSQEQQIEISQDLTSGVYFVNVKAGDNSKVIKMIVK